MALRKIFEIEGKSIIDFQYGKIDTGTQKTAINAICKIVAIDGGKEQLNIAVSFDGGNTKYSRHYSFVPSVEDGSSNFIKQAYLYLKTLPEFAGAEDC